MLSKSRPSRQFTASEAELEKARGAIETLLSDLREALEVPGIQWIKMHVKVDRLRIQAINLRVERDVPIDRRPKD